MGLFFPYRPRTPTRHNYTTSSQPKSCLRGAASGRNQECSLKNKMLRLCGAGVTGRRVCDKIVANAPDVIASQPKAGAAILASGRSEMASSAYASSQ